MMALMLGRRLQDLINHYERLIRVTSVLTPPERTPVIVESEALARVHIGQLRALKEQLGG